MLPMMGQAVLSLVLLAEVEEVLRLMRTMTISDLGAIGTPQKS